MGETLQLARERKGVDLYRAERDTKIRLRYLSALEDGDYDELPAPVYTKGFLRNYAIYLGLEPDDILDRWRDEMEQMRTATRVAVVPPPMPLVEPGGRRLHITSGMIVASLVLLVVIAFVGYIAIQLARFVETTPVELTYPADRVSAINADSVNLEGTAGPGALVTITGPGDLLYNVSADENGNWTREVPLALGRNDFRIVATDPVTQRESKPLLLTVNVPLPSPSPTVSGAPSPSPSAPVVALELNLISPAEGLVSNDGAVIVQGTTNGTRLTINSAYVGPPGATPAPTESPGESPAPSPTQGPIAPARDITVSAAGTFSETLQYDVGRWLLTIVSYASGQTPVARQVTIDVQPPTPVEMSLVITVETSDAWGRVVADGVRVEGYGTRTFHVGETHTFSALNQFCVRTANAGSLHLALDGQDLGVLGEPGATGSWVVRRGVPPEPAPEPCT